MMRLGPTRVYQFAIDPDRRVVVERRIRAASDSEDTALGTCSGNAAGVWGHPSDHSSAGLRTVNVLLGAWMCGAGIGFALGVGVARVW